MDPVALAVAASALWGVGTVVQKAGISRRFPDSGTDGPRRRLGRLIIGLLTSPVWLAGLALVLAGGGLFATALGRGDITVVQPVVGLTGVVAAAVGVIFLRERVGRREWAGIGVIVFGVALVGVTAGPPSARPPSGLEIALLCCACTALAAGTVGLRRFGISAEFRLSLAAGIVFGLGNPLAKLLTQRVVEACGPPFSLARPELWLAALTDYPLPLVIVANLTGEVLVQAALASGRASIVTPIVTIVGTVVPISAALAVFGEELRPLQAVGIGVVVLGTALMAGRERAATTAG